MSQQEQLPLKRDPRSNPAPGDVLESEDGTQFKVVSVTDAYVLYERMRDSETFVSFRAKMRRKHWETATRQTRVVKQDRR